MNSVTYDRCLEKITRNGIDALMGKCEHSSNVTMGHNRRKGQSLLDGQEKKCVVLRLIHSEIGLI